MRLGLTFDTGCDADCGYRFCHTAGVCVYQADGATAIPTSGGSASGASFPIPLCSPEAGEYVNCKLHNPKRSTASRTSLPVLVQQTIGVLGVLHSAAEASIHKSVCRPVKRMQPNLKAAVVTPFINASPAPGHRPFSCHG